MLQQLGVCTGSWSIQECVLLISEDEISESQAANRDGSHLSGQTNQPASNPHRYLEGFGTLSLYSWDEEYEER